MKNLRVLIQSQMFRLTALEVNQILLKCLEKNAGQVVGIASDLFLLFPWTKKKKIG